MTPSQKQLHNLMKRVALDPLALPWEVDEYNERHSKTTPFRAFVAGTIFRINQDVATLHVPGGDLSVSVSMDEFQPLYEIVFNKVYDGQRKSFLDVAHAALDDLGFDRIP